MKKILIIEDNRDLANFLKILMELSGFEASIVHNGTHGLEVLMTEPIPDAVVLDLHLPGLSGEEIYTWMHDRGQAKRVLLCSADSRLVEQYKSLGAHTIMKPASVDEIQQAMQEIFAA